MAAVVAELTHFIPPNAKFISSLPVLISFSRSHSLSLTPDPDVVRTNEFHAMAYTIQSFRSLFVLLLLLLPHHPFLLLNNSALLACLPAFLFDDDGTVYPT
jgi:hypothetical protein